LKKQIFVFVALVLFCSVLVVPFILNDHTGQGKTISEPESTQPTQITPQPTIETSPQSSPLPQNALQPAEQSNPQNAPQVIVASSNRTLSEAIGNATNYLQVTSEPYAFLWLNVAYRRFNISLFSDSLQRYDQAILQTSPENQSALRVFRRIIDYNNQLQEGDLQSVTGQTDKLTVPALYCNRYGLPSNYVDTLVKAASSQDYMVTHALLALIWINENGYSFSMPAEYYEYLFRANVGLINDDAVVTDVELEAAAFLSLAGQSSMVPIGFFKSVVAAQKIDGGWNVSNLSTESSNWHSSVLALILLLHEQYPARLYPTMLAPATMV
jgi:hypothetical protein